MVEESEEMEAENVLDYTQKLKETFHPTFGSNTSTVKMKPKERTA